MTTPALGLAIVAVAISGSLFVGVAFVVACVVGIVVTFVSAVGPARRASKVPAIAAFRDGADGPADRTGRRLLGAGALGVGGVAAGGLGLFGGLATAPTIAMLAIGAIGIFTAVTLLSPAFAGPLTRVLGWPARRMSGVAGKLARTTRAATRAAPPPRRPRS